MGIIMPFKSIVYSEYSTKCPNFLSELCWGSYLATLSVCIDLEKKNIGQKNNVLVAESPQSSIDRVCTVEDSQTFLHPV